MINILVDDVKLTPTVGTSGSAGYDLYLSYDARIAPGHSVMVGTGVRMEIPEGYHGLILPRSSTGALGMKLTNTVGLIDSDYRGEIMLPIYNYGKETRLVYKYDRLFQLVLEKSFVPPLNLVTKLSSTSRGVRGFGSTNQ